LYSALRIIAAAIDVARLHFSQSFEWKAAELHSRRKVAHPKSASRFSAFAITPV
jgi:hypothetical protein